MDTIRKYNHFDRYLNELIADIYPQPIDESHTEASFQVIDSWIPKLLGCKSVVDMGCGQIAPQERFEQYGVAYVGVALGHDALVCQNEGKRVIASDMTFTDLEDESFDLVYSRHSLEHSPFPLLTLMEWHRIARHWLLVVLPSPDHHKWAALNHYAVMNHEQARFFLSRAGWNVIWTDNRDKTEIRYMCEKVARQ